VFEKVGDVNHIVFMFGERSLTVPLGRDQSGKDVEDLPHPHIRRDAHS
jgi:hypothetical protein